MFGSIKKTTHSEDAPHLSLDQKRAMAQLTGDVIDAVMQFEDKMLGGQGQAMVNAVGHMRAVK